MKLRGHRLTDREVWVRACAILAEHGAMTPDYILAQLGEAVGDPSAVKNLRRIAVAVDEISDARPQ